MLRAEPGSRRSPFPLPAEPFCSFRRPETGSGKKAETPEGEREGPSERLGAPGRKAEETERKPGGTERAGAGQRDRLSGSPPRLLPRPEPQTPRTGRPPRVGKIPTRQALAEDPPRAVSGAPLPGSRDDAAGLGSLGPCARGERKLTEADTALVCAAGQWRGPCSARTAAATARVPTGIHVPREGDGAGGGRGEAGRGGVAGGVAGGRGRCPQAPWKSRSPARVSRLVCRTGANRFGTSPHPAAGTAADPFAGSRFGPCAVGGVKGPAWLCGHWVDRGQEPGPCASSQAGPTAPGDPSSVRRWRRCTARAGVERKPGARSLDGSETWRYGLRTRGTCAHLAASSAQQLAAPSP